MLAKNAILYNRSRAKVVALELVGESTLITKMAKKKKYVYFYTAGKFYPNPRCKCPRKDKSKCFRIFSVDKEGKFNGWKIECPYFNRISREVVRRLTPAMNTLGLSYRGKFSK